MTSMSKAHLFQSQSPRPLVSGQGESPRDALVQLHNDLGLGLEPAEIAYLGDAYEQLGRSPTDAELMMFAQVNSEHCRHKIFNAAWTIDGQPHNESLFDMIRNTHATHPGGVFIRVLGQLSRYARLAGKGVCRHRGQSKTLRSARYRASHRSEGGDTQSPHCDITVSWRGDRLRWRDSRRSCDRPRGPRQSRTNRIHRIEPQPRGCRRRLGGTSRSPRPNRFCAPKSCSKRRLVPRATTTNSGARRSAAIFVPLRRQLAAKMKFWTAGVTTSRS